MLVDWLHPLWPCTNLIYSSQYSKCWFSFFFVVQYVHWNLSSIITLKTSDLETLSFPPPNFTCTSFSFTKSLPGMNTITLVFSGAIGIFHFKHHLSMTCRSTFIFIQLHTGGANSFLSVLIPSEMKAEWWSCFFWNYTLDRILFIWGILAVVKYRISLSIRQSIFPSKTVPKI